MEGLFDFEQDGRYPLRRIPMRIRFNLDACGVRFSLTAWTLLSRDEREWLLNLRCGSEQERQEYRDTLAQMLKPYADNPEAVLEKTIIDTMPAWQQTAIVPTAMVAHLMECALPIPTLEQWQNLSNLQRFALVKLTRSGHRNSNLIPALKEFGIE
tara:strand:- start:39601 stop:40065 length:465 start_codon:yes stop_codon:yes gene_type:complete